MHAADLPITIGTRIGSLPGGLIFPDRGESDRGKLKAARIVTNLDLLIPCTFLPVHQCPLKSPISRFLGLSRRPRPFSFYR